MAHEALIKALETNRLIGGGIPVFFGEEKKTRDWLAEGVSREDANDWVITGCNTASIPSDLLPKWAPFGVVIPSDLLLKGKL